MDREELFNKIQKGDQNRYGEIEYELSDAERISGLKNILTSTESTPLTTSESRSIESILYWNLCGNITIIEETCKLVEQYSYIPSVRKGFLEALNERYTLESRIRYLESIIWNFDRLNLTFSKEIRSDIKDIVEKWKYQELKDNQSEKVQKILDSKIFLNQ